MILYLLFIYLHIIYNDFLNFIINNFESIYCFYLYMEFLMYQVFIHDTLILVIHFLFIFFDLYSRTINIWKHKKRIKVGKSNHFCDWLFWWNFFWKINTNWIISAPSGRKNKKRYMYLLKKILFFCLQFDTVQKNNRVWNRWRHKNKNT